MKLTQLLLCKTPFTPSYEHLVTGCSSEEFYNKLYNDQNNTTSINIDMGNTLGFRTVRESDREIVFSINLNSIELDYFKPYQFNYVATYETDGSYRFWFIDSYNLDNSILNPSASFYCSIDYWHSYLLNNVNSIKDQHIVRKIGNDPYIFIPDDISVPHEEFLLKSRRVLWARCRISTTEFTEDKALEPGVQNAELGLPYDGGMVTVFIPLIEFDGEDIIDYQVSVKFLTAHRIAKMDYETKHITFTIENREGVPYTQDYQIGDVINRLSSIATILDFSLTFIPPINYAIGEFGHLEVREDGSGFTPVGIYKTTDGYPIYGFTYFASSHYPFEFTRRVNLLNSAEQINYLNAYPYNYYKIYIGGQCYYYPYPVTTVDVEFKCFGSANSMCADLYINYELVEKNISICQNIPLPINVTNADVINARYLQGYRELGLNMALVNSVSNITSSVTGIFSKSPISKAINVIPNAISSAYNIAKEYYEYESQSRTPSKQYYPVTEALSALLGDYPFIISYSVNRDYESMIQDRIKVLGHKTDYYGKPVYAPTNSYEFYKIDYSNIFSQILNDRGNNIIMNAFVRGVHLWDYSVPLDNIGIYN